MPRTPDDITDPGNPKDAKAWLLDVNNCEGQEGRLRVALPIHDDRKGLVAISTEGDDGDYRWWVDLTHEEAVLIAKVLLVAAQEAREE